MLALCAHTIAPYVIIGLTIVSYIHFIAFGEGLTGFQVLQMGNADSRPRAAIIAKPHLNLWYDSRFSDADMVVGIIQYNNKQVFIASI